MTHQDSSTGDANQETILPFTIGANFAWLIAQVHTAELPWFFQLLESVDAHTACSLCGSPHGPLHLESLGFAAPGACCCASSMSFAWLIAQVHTAELPWFFQLLEPVDARAARRSRVQLKCLGFSTSWSPSTRAQHVPCADHRVTPKVLKWRNWGVEGTPNLNVEILN